MPEKMTRSNAKNPKRPKTSKAARAPKKAAARAAKKPAARPTKRGASAVKKKASGAKAPAAKAKSKRAAAKTARPATGKSRRAPRAVPPPSGPPVDVSIAPPPYEGAPVPYRVPIPPAATLSSPQDPLAFAASKIRDIPDFPTPGIMFKDITPLLAHPRAFHIVLDSLAERFIGDHVDAVVGIESRGFIFGGALAARLNASFIPVRKPGKLPADVDEVRYETEYSFDALQMHADSIDEEARVLIVDDLLATGGTSRAAAELVRRQGGYVIAYAFVIELGMLGGRERLLPVRVESLIRY